MAKESSLLHSWAPHPQLKGKRGEVSAPLMVTMKPSLNKGKPLRLSQLPGAVQAEKGKAMARGKTPCCRSAGANAPKPGWLMRMWQLKAKNAQCSGVGMMRSPPRARMSAGQGKQEHKRVLACPRQQQPMASAQASPLKKQGKSHSRII